MVFDGIRQIHVCLCTTDEDVEFTFALKNGDDVAGSADMSVSSALDGIEYFQFNALRPI